MVSNPFGGEPLEVAVTADTAGLESGLGGAMEQLDSMKGAVAGLGVALAGLSAKGLASAVSAASDFESQLVELEKVTNPQTAREMGTAIQDMASRMPLAQSELAGIAEQAGRLGIEGTDNIENFTEVTAEMATATDLTAEEAADSFARMSTLMNEPIENVRAIGDATNALSNSMATSSSEITDAATRSSGALTNMGMASSDVLALNAAMNEVSPSARVAGTQLRRMAQEMMDPGKIDDMAAALGMSTSEFKAMREEDPTQVIRMMAESMGEGGEAANRLRSTLSTTSRQALAGLSNNLDSMNKGLETSQQQFDEGGSLAEEFESAMGTFQNTVQITRNNLRNLAISTGQLLLPALTELMRGVNSLVARFSAFNKATDGVAGVVTLLTGLFGGLIVAGGAIVSMMGGLSAALAPAVAGFSALGSAISILLGPIGLLIGIVATLGAMWASNFGGIRTQTMRVVSAIRDALQPVFEAFGGSSTDILGQLSAAWTSFMSVAEPIFARIFTWIADNLIVAIQQLGQFLEWFVPIAVSGFQRFGEAVRIGVGVATRAWDAFTTAVDTAVTFVWENALQPFIDWFVPIWQETMGPVVEEAAKTWSVWSQILTYTINTVRTNINAFLAWLAPYWNAYWEEFNAQFQVFMSEMQAIWDLVGDDLIATARFVWDLIASVVKGTLTVISGILRTVAAVMRADWSEAWNIIKNTVMTIATGIADFLVTWGERANARIAEIVRGIIDWFIQLGQRLIWGSLIPDMLTAIRDAFVNYLTAVLNFVKQTFNNILSFITTQFTATKDFLVTTLSNIYQFFSQQFTLLRNLVSDIWSALHSDTESVWGAISTFLSGTLSNIQQFFSRQFSAIRDFVSRTLSNIYRTVRGQMSSVQQFFASTLGGIVRRVKTWASNAYSEFWDGLDRMYRALGRAGRQLKRRMASIASDVVQEVKDVGSNMYNAGKNLIQSIVNGINNSPNAVKNAVESHVGKAAKFLPWSDADEGPLSNLSESGPGFVRTVAEGIRDEGGRMVAAVAEMASAAADSLTEAAQGALGSNLSEMVVQSAAADSAGADSGAASQMNQNQAPIAQELDSLAQSNRQAIQRLEGEIAQRLDTLISHSKNSEGVVRIDGKQAGEIIESTMTRKQYSTEIHE